MEIFMDLSDEMQDYELWKNLVIEDLREKCFSHYHEDTRWIKQIIFHTINNYKDGLSYINRLFNETFNIEKKEIEEENILIGILYCLKYIEYNKIKDIAIPMFNKSIDLNNGDMQEILIMMYYDSESLWKYSEGIHLLDAKRPFIRKYLEHYFEDIKFKFDNQ